MGFRGINGQRSVREDLQIMEAMAKPEPAAPRSPKLRSRFQVMGALVCAMAVFAGLHVSRGRRASATTQGFAQSLAGTWELRSVNGDPVGPKEDSSVILQRVTFENGKINGNTRLRANTAAATSAMPFPDASAKSVMVSADGRYVDVRWEGVYTALDDHRLELRVGKAIYLVEAHLDARTHFLEFDHDTILTFSGPARYFIASAATVQKPDNSVE